MFISVYQDDVEQLALWRIKNNQNLVLNVMLCYAMELILRWKKMDIQPLFMVADWEGLRILVSLCSHTGWPDWVHQYGSRYKDGIAETALPERAQNDHLTQNPLVSFYHCSIENIWPIASVLCFPAPEGRHIGPKDNRLPSPLPEGSVQFPLCQERKNIFSVVTLDSLSLNRCPQADISGHQNHQTEGQVYGGAINTQDTAIK